MLRQIEWWVQNASITKNGVLPVTALFFRKFCFSLRTSYKELILYTIDPNAHIPTFCKLFFDGAFLWLSLKAYLLWCRTLVYQENVSKLYRKFYLSSIIFRFYRKNTLHSLSFSFLMKSFQNKILATPFELIIINGC